MGRLCVFHVVVSLLVLSMGVGVVSGIGANWGTQATHPVPPDIVVRMLRENGIQKVKLFDADSDTLNALSNSRIEVMVGIPNDMLYGIATNMKAAVNWVKQNVSDHVDKGVLIRYVAVGNEPFLQTYNGTFLETTFPALRNIQAALIKAGLGSRVKVTCPQNADVYETTQAGLPSGGDFRSDIHQVMIDITKFLNDNGAPFTVNIYPFISLYIDANFPVDYAFFEGNGAPIIDGGISYTNMFDANHDTLVWALQKNGFANMPIIIGEIGWPTDGDRNANLMYAQRFNQGFMTHIATGKGTPMRSGPVDAYLFSLIDEDAKSISPGNFERHWGIFYFDGKPKYPLNLGTTNTGMLAPARGVVYLERKWCVMTPKASLDDPQVALSVSYACSLADCTSLGYGTSCGNLDTRGNISYAFNSYYQIQNQLDRACKFGNLSMVVTRDPSTETCRFGTMIEPYEGGSTELSAGYLQTVITLVVVTIVVLFS
ncbi:glucan endo-1,3-beta-glucosidase 6-like [Papaver somniferum]|uniref:glucan endo-1,3-beta-glucosidase 6-like n=1 Tax=Papaver somniferum TaxID=3469 RepID=UPI000E6F4B5A|nr:glucan endo-1,3-beta-glucosidase 6-like [Papaver somniferum]